MSNEQNEQVEFSTKKLPIYSYGHAPYHLVTVAQLRKLGLPLPPYPSAYVRGRDGKKRFPLYNSRKAKQNADNAQSLIGENGDTKPLKVDWQKILKARSLIIDTETTGLSLQDQIIEIAGLWVNGDVAFDYKSRPTVPIHEKASEVHGYRIEHLRNYPYFPTVFQTIAPTIEQADYLVIYNAPFDMRLLDQTCKAFGIKVPSDWQGKVVDAMIKYVKLGGDHTALGDCRQTLEHIKKLV